MKTLNDKWLGIVTKEKEKKKRIKENREKLDSNDPYIMEDARNLYIQKFGTNGSRNGKYDKVIIDSKGYVNRIRSDIEQEKDFILDDNASFGIYGGQPWEKFFEKTEELFNS